MFYFASEPEGATYEALIQLAIKRCETFSLIWRAKRHPKPAQDEMLLALTEFLIAEKDTKQWPGTLSAGSATIRHYRAVAEVAPILCRIEGLYSWLHPQYPEDLAFYCANGDVWLTSIAHEREAWVEDGNLSLDELLRAVPDLQVSPQRQSATRLKH
ncbi:MAG TPA: hypothetical protein VF627_05555 [Abditibacterium sp.]|jgi:hypothetical protein